MKVILHLGVHKTATTYIQSRLYNSKDGLLSSGIGYIGLDETRDCLTSKLNWSVSELKSSIFPKIYADKMIISDENIIGGTGSPDSLFLYPKACGNVKKVLEVFSEADVEVFITIRNLKDYLISRYSESLRHFQYKNFHHYYRNVDFETLSWYQLFDSIFESGVERINVTEFSSIFKDETEYFNTLLGEEGVQLEPASTGGAISRSKISEEVNQILKLVNKHFPKPAVKRIMNILDGFEQKSETSHFSPFSDEMTDNLLRQYMNDIERMLSDSRICFSGAM